MNLLPVDNNLMSIAPAFSMISVIFPVLPKPLKFQIRRCHNFNKFYTVTCEISSGKGLKTLNDISPPQTFNHIELHRLQVTCKVMYLWWITICLDNGLTLNGWTQWWPGLLTPIWQMAIKLALWIDSKDTDLIWAHFFMKIVLFTSC